MMSEARGRPFSLPFVRALWLVMLLGIGELGVALVQELLSGEYSLVLEPVLRGTSVLMSNMRQDEVWSYSSPRPSWTYPVTCAAIAVAGWLAGRRAQHVMRRRTPVARATTDAATSETYRSASPSPDHEAARRAERTSMRAFATRLAVTLSVASALIVSAFMRLPRAPWLPAVSQSGMNELAERACALVEGAACGVVVLSIVAAVWPSRRRVLGAARRP